MSNENTEMIDVADDNGHGLVRGLPSYSQISLTNGSWLANVDEDEAEQVTMSASGKRYGRVKLTVMFDAFGHEYGNFVHATTTPQGALRLAEQLVTAADSAMQEESWSPEQSPVEYHFDTSVTGPVESDSD